MQRYKNTLNFIPILSLVYVLFAVFIFHRSIYYFYASSLVLIVTAYILLRSKGIPRDLLIGVVLVVLASIGLSAATLLTNETFESLKNPNHVSSCSLSPIVSCAKAIDSDSSSIFGIPNTLIGVFGWGAVLTAGITILAGARHLSKYWWRTLLTGITFFVGFCIWLIAQGLYRIGTLCLYCMATWFVTFAVFWFVFAYCVDNEYVAKNKLTNFMSRYRNDWIRISILIVLVLIVFRWSDYWQSLL